MAGQPGPHPYHLHLNNLRNVFMQAVLRPPEGKPFIVGFLQTHKWLLIFLLQHFVTQVKQSMDTFFFKHIFCKYSCIWRLIAFYVKFSC